MTLADLGGYTATVRDLAGQTTSEIAWLKLARWIEWVVFDASTSMAAFSNGRSWVEWFAESADLTAPSQVKNYATGRASCADAQAQITRYLASFTPSTNTLIAPWWLGMTADVIWNGRPVPEVVSNYNVSITQLARGGGKCFVLPNLVPLYLSPGLDIAYARELDYAAVCSDTEAVRADIRSRECARDVRRMSDLSWGLFEEGDGPASEIVP